MDAIAILGPTGIGKSAIAIRLAEQVRGEILSCDSMMVYRGMDIGTAKPTRDEQARIRHHLIDILDVHQPYNAKLFCQDATTALNSIVARGNVPILCGGTGLYAKAFLYEFAFHPHDAAVAAAVRASFAATGPDPLIAELAQADTAVAQDAKKNPHRLLRYVEILRLTGKPIQPVLQHQDDTGITWNQWVLLPEPATVRDRLRERTKRMLADGWIEETERLIRLGLMASPTASKALGYRLIAAYLRGGINSLDELEERIVTQTAQYARRQRTWFKRQHPGAHTLNPNSDWREDDIVAHIFNRWNAR